MRLYGAIQKVEPQDDGTVRVYGIATSEAVDEQGEIVRADAIRAAIPDYMRFPALREMHQLSAAGTTLEAEVCEDGTTRVVAHVVDPVAVAKVKNQVYRGFSIGGRVTQREPGNPKTITSLVLNEISLVDRPANPEAIFDCWKAAMQPDAFLGVVEPPVGEGGAPGTEQARSGSQPFNAPIQIWTCAAPDHRHLAKADALECLRINAGFANDGRANDVARTFVANDERAVSGASLTKALRDAGQLARVIAELDWLRDALELEAVIENDQSSQPARLQEIIAELCDFLTVLTTEESGEVLSGTETSGSPPASAMPQMRGTIGVSDLERAAAFLRKGRVDVRQRAGGTIVKTKPSRADQALLDMARIACDRCLQLGGLSVDERANMDRASHYLQEAGTMPIQLRTTERAEDDDPPIARPELPVGERPEVDIAKVLAGLVSGMLCKRERAHQNLIELAHECVQALTDGRVCEQTTKLGAGHSKGSMELLKAAHRQLVAAGARCDAMGDDEPRPPVQLGSQAYTRAAELTSAYESAEKAALTKVLGEVVPMIERLTKRVDEIARTPLPALTMAKGTVSVSKQQDRGSNVGDNDPALSPEAIAAALAKMSKEEQTLTLIKASYATPIRIAGSAVDQR